MKIDFDQVWLVKSNSSEPPVERYPQWLRLVIWFACAAALVVFWTAVAVGIGALFG